MHTKQGIHIRRLLPALLLCIMLLPFGMHMQSSWAANVKSVDIHINGGVGYYCVFYYKLTDGSIQTIKVGGEETQPATFPDGQVLKTGDTLLYVEITDSKGTPLAIILESTIGHRSDKNCCLQADGSMGDGGVFVVNGGNINFWFNGLGVRQPGTSLITPEKVWLAANKTPDPDPPTSFTFNLSGKTATGVTIPNIPEKSGISVVVPNGTYKVTEPVVDGYKLISITSSTMTGNVTDMDATIVAKDGNYSVTFTNKKIPVIPAGANVDLTLDATKMVHGGVALTSGQFNFAVIDEAGDTVATGSNDAAGNITFTDINYTADDIGEHNYTVIETGTAAAGWSLTDVEFPMTVEVDFDGTAMVATPSFPDGQPVFINTYGAGGSVDLAATVIVSGAILTDEEFCFAVKDEHGTIVATGLCNSDGSINFSNIEYTADDVGLHTYTFVQTSPSRSGWTIDLGGYTVTVDVTDNGDGTLTATPVYPSGATVFENSYEAHGSLALEAHEQVKTGGITEDEFTAKVLDEDGHVVAIGTNDEDGNIEFHIDYTLEDVGLHEYTIIETGTSGKWALDPHKFHVLVDVIDNSDGTLGVDFEYINGPAKFVHAIAPAPGGGTQLQDSSPGAVDGPDQTTEPGIAPGDNGTGSGDDTVAPTDDQGGSGNDSAGQQPDVKTPRTGDDQGVAVSICLGASALIVAGAALLLIRRKSSE